MKRILLLFALIGALLTADAAGYNAQQQALISGIKKNLETRGFSVENQDDGLKFKSDGGTYYVEVSETDNSPMYVRLRRYVKYEEDGPIETIKKNLNELNETYGVKVLCIGNVCVISTEMYVKSAAQFNYVFGDLLRLMEGVYAELP